MSSARAGASSLVLLIATEPVRGVGRGGGASGLSCTALLYLAQSGWSAPRKCSTPPPSGQAGAGGMGPWASHRKWASLQPTYYPRAPEKAAAGPGSKGNLAEDVPPLCVPLRPDAVCQPAPASLQQALALLSYQTWAEAPPQYCARGYKMYIRHGTTSGRPFSRRLRSHRYLIAMAKSIRNLQPCSLVHHAPPGESGVGAWRVGGGGPWWGGGTAIMVATAPAARQRGGRGPVCPLWVVGGWGKRN